jgi:tungstate transport system permease protein
VNEAVDGLPPAPHAQFVDGLHKALDLIASGDPAVVSTTLRTLRLAVESTAIAAAVGLPLGCLLGVGRFRGRRVVLAGANAITKLPPVVIGVLGILLLTSASRWGGGPLAALNWRGSPNGVYFVQTLLAFPIIVALTATALQSVSPRLLEQARAFGAPGWRRGVLALREARAAVLAGVVLAFGVTITAVGAIIVIGNPLDTMVDVGGGRFRAEPMSLAVGALTEFRQDTAGQYAEKPLAVAYATILFGVFVLIAVAVTMLQRGRQTAIAGRAS